MFIERRLLKDFFLAPRGAKHKAGAGNIALRWSAGLEVHSSTYKH
ncbi:MAG: hypothetical protein ABI923_11700 [bacterium]